MTFCVMIPTRDRPALLQRALRSVLAQSSPPDEIVVIDDGSGDAAAAAVAALVAGLGPRGRLVRLPPVPGGHGPAYARNAGVAASTAPFICFLDHDDIWSDPDYLRHLQAVLDSAPQPFDLHLADQHAFAGAARLSRTIWIEDLAGMVAARPRDPAGSVQVRVADLLRCTGFCHLNATCAGRRLFTVLGGFDPRQRYESDRDFFLRAIDLAEIIRYTPRVVAHHSVPRRDAGANVSTSMSDRRRHEFQLRLLGRVASQSSHPALRDHANLHLAHTRKKLAVIQSRAGDHAGAWAHARAALAVRFSWKWAAFTGWTGLRHVVTRAREPNSAAPAAAPARLQR